MGIFQKLENWLNKFLEDNEESISSENTKRNISTGSNQEKGSAPAENNAPIVPYKTPFGKLIYTKINSFLQNTNKDLAEIELFLQNSLKNTPADDQQTPSPLAFRFLQNYRLYGADYNKEYFYNMMVALADMKTKDFVFASFANILLDLSVDEFKIIKLLMDNNPLYTNLLDVKEVSSEHPENNRYVMQNFSFLNTSPKLYCEKPEFLGLYFDNLLKAGIVRIVTDADCIDNTICDLLRKNNVIQDIMRNAQTSGKQIVFIEKVIQFTAFGKMLADICFYTHDELRQNLLSLHSK